MIQIAKEFADKPVRIISINTMNPDGMVDAEIKKYKMEYPVFYGRGQNINRDFKVEKLPRLIFVKSDTTIIQDVLFMKTDEIRTELQKLLNSKP